MKRIYISGPMTGLPSLNFPAFNAEALRLRGMGYEVVNPAELNHAPEASWSDCMRADIKALMDCDAVAVLEGWQCSRGALLEVTIARELGMPIVTADSVRAIQ